MDNVIFYNKTRNINLERKKAILLPLDNTEKRKYYRAVGLAVNFPNTFIIFFQNNVTIYLLLFIILRLFFPHFSAGQTQINYSLVN